jgi:hypothetical protein
MNKELDIVYVSHDSIAEGIGMSQIIPVVIGLANKGWNVGIISCEKTEISTEIKEQLEAVGVNWTALRFGRTGALGGVGRLIRIAIRLPRARAYHCRGDLAAVATHLSSRSPFLWDVRGLWIDQKIVIGSINTNPLIIWLAKRLERIAAKNAAAVSTLTEAVYPILIKRNPFLTRFHSVVATCTDLEKFYFNSKLPIEKKLLLSGVFNNYYDIPATGDFISSFREKEKLKVTWCHGKEALKSALNVGEDEIKVMKQSEMQSEIASSSFGLAICKQDIGDSLAGVMPTKVAEFLAVGRPVIVSNGVGDLEKLLLSTRTGVVIKSNMDLAVTELLDLLDDDKTPIRCRALAEQHFSMVNAIDTYNSIFTRLLKQEGLR